MYLHACLCSPITCIERFHKPTRTLYLSFRQLVGCVETASVGKPLAMNIPDKHTPTQSKIFTDMDLFQLPGFRVSASCGEGIDFGGPRVGVSFEEPQWMQTQPTVLDSTQLVLVLRDPWCRSRLLQVACFSQTKCRPYCSPRFGETAGFFSSGPDFTCNWGQLPFRVGRSAKAL